MDKQKQGKRNRAAGQRFERKVRADLEFKDWVVDRWGNNISDFPEENINLPPEEREDRKLVPARSGFGLRTTGFPDFIAFKIRSGYSYYDEEGKIIDEYLQPTCDKIVIGVECKSLGYLDREEKEKCKWLLNNNVFSKVLIASKSKKRGKIEYKEFK